MKESIKSFYKTKVFPVAKERLKAIFRDIELKNKTCKAVEMGAGTGILSQTLKELYPNFDVIAIDRNPDHFLSFNDSINIKIVRSDIKSVPLQQESVDYVFYYNVLHHLTPKEIVMSIKEAYRILKPDGKIVIIETSPNPENKAQEAMLEIYRIESEINSSIGETPEKLYTLHQMIFLLNKIGILVEKKIKYSSTSIFWNPLWKYIKEDLEEKLKKLDHAKRTRYAKRLQEINAKVRKYGIQSLPQYVLVGEKATITVDHIPVKKSSIKFRIEYDGSGVLYDKDKGMVLLNKTGTLMWMLCNGERSVAEIANEVTSIISGARYENVLTDTYGFFLSLYQQGFIKFKKS